jgi:chaperonin cofactor prefoldin
VPTRAPEAADAEAQARALRAARKAALHEAEERVRTLERQADDLRERLHGEDVTDDQRRQLEETLASVLLQIEDAERALVRAEWALREVEE